MKTLTYPKISQSSLKQLEKKDACLYYWQKRFIECVVKEQPTYLMKRGSFFEFLCIGGGSGRSEDVTDLPRLKDGKKSAEHIRIEEQAERFKKWISDNGFEILPETIQMQITLDTEHGTDGVIDFMLIDTQGKIGYPGEIFITDLKFTGDIYADFGFVNWNKPQELDLTQQISYTRIWFENTGQLLRSILYVADCSTAMNVKTYVITIDPDKNFPIIEERFKNAYELVDAYVSEGIDMPANPSMKNCKDCAFKERCQFRQEGPVFEEIYI